MLIIRNEYSLEIFSFLIIDYLDANNFYIMEMS